MAVVEQNSVALGVTIDTLMENAGRVVAEEAGRHLPAAPARLAVVASTGNNGGDGTCAAFYLHQWGYSPEVWLVRPPSEIRSRAALRCYERIEHRVPVHVRVPRAEELATMPLVLDALLGTGQSAELRAPIREAVAAIRASRAPVLAIDLPTGVLDPNGVRPAWTVALTTTKTEMENAPAGEVTVRDIGMPPNAWRRTGPGEFLFFHAPDGRRDRGRSGRLLIVGGGPYAGAPALAGLAALRSGAERSTILAPSGAAERIQSFSPNLIVRPLGPERFRPSDLAAVLDFVRAAPPRAVVVGMGAGAHAETLELMATLQRELLGKVPLVVDADALSALPPVGEFEARGKEDRQPVLVATPNSGEFSRVFGGSTTAPLEEKVRTIERVAAERHLTLLVKGEPDIVSDGLSTFENAHHHPAMTVGGVGDVLAGVVGSLLAQGLAPLHAARLGTYWVGSAGLRAATTHSFGLTATDVIEELPRALVGGLERVQRAS
jgi:ADP-dependent NAD(P)H-hydrate dehydratase / NAD(P)H-hydrate epimerase